MMYTSLRVAAWTAVGLLCLLCGCGSEPNAYDRVASQTRVQRALLPVQSQDSMEIDDALADAVFVYLQAAITRTPAGHNHIQVADLREWRAWMREQDAVCQTAILSLYDCLRDDELQAKVERPDRPHRVTFQACDAQHSDSITACASETD